MNCSRFSLGLLCCVMILLCIDSCIDFVAPQSFDLAKMQAGRKTQFANGGWNLDRYKDSPTLDAKKAMILADLKGPGVITHIHTTRHSPAELFARGIVLEIRFDNADEPAVCVPLADFFGDGCNGRSMLFSANLIECVPWSYNCYFPMPFKERAEVILRNDTDNNTLNYSYIEWESLPEWNNDYAYFHATYRRDLFQLKKDTNYQLIELAGRGHFLGRQMSIATDEPLWRNFGCVMEGNNEVHIDGDERRIDYLGSEDSFTFSWGFQSPFAGQHAGMPFVQVGDREQLLSIYRFHDHMPIRFEKSLAWNINWSMERHYNNLDPIPAVKESAKDHEKRWDAVLARNGGWIDYAHVSYWYQDRPGGFKHQPLPKPEERVALLLKSNR